jgi:hypothetical protein
MNKERLYPEISKIEKMLDAFTPGTVDQDAAGAIDSLVHSFEQEGEVPPKGQEVLVRMRSNFASLFSSATSFQGQGGWKNIVHALRCDTARLKMVVSMNADKKK